MYKKFSFAAQSFPVPDAGVEDSRTPLPSIIDIVVPVQEGRAKRLELVVT